MESLPEIVRQRWLSPPEIIHLLNLQEHLLALFPLSEQHRVDGKPSSGQLFLFAKQARGKNWRQDHLSFTMRKN